MKSFIQKGAVMKMIWPCESNDVKEEKQSEKSPLVSKHKFPRVKVDLLVGMKEQTFCRTSVLFRILMTPINGVQHEGALS